MIDVVVIGAGIGGLAAAALLAKEGLAVAVLEAHSDLGGCAATFSRDGYRFDSGATLALGFDSGGPWDRLGRALGLPPWDWTPAEPALVVHLPDGRSVPRTGGAERWAVREEHFGASCRTFWTWQEHTADHLWDLALNAPPWLPQGKTESLELLRSAGSWASRDLRGRLRVELFRDAFGNVGRHLAGCEEALRVFVDAQLLISAQVPSPSANALYGAAALDLPRRGPVHVAGGMGAIAGVLAGAVKESGGQVFTSTEVKRIQIERGRVRGVETSGGECLEANTVVANVGVGNLARLLGEHAAPRIRRRPVHPPDGWGAFMLYLALDGGVVPEDLALHHQIVAREPLSEGNSVFLSLSPSWDETRAPRCCRAATVSTHTALEPWWRAHRSGREAYAERKKRYTKRVLELVARTLPNVRDGSHFVLSGTPVTFERYTQRLAGWVGGYPQTGLSRALAPRITRDIWLVGDSVFPGQSTAAVALGAMRVARAILASL